MWVLVDHSKSSEDFFEICTKQSLITPQMRVNPLTSRQVLVRNTFRLLTRHEASNGLMKGEPRIVCVLTMWSSRRAWMSSTDDKIEIPWKSIKDNVVNVLLSCWKHEMSFERERERERERGERERESKDSFYCKSRLFRTHSIFVSWALRPFVCMKFSYSRWPLRILTCFVPFACILLSYGSRRIWNIRK